MDSAVLHVYEFGPAVLDERAQSLQIQGLVVDLQPQSWRLLLTLVQHEGGLIPKSDLESAVWHGRYVGENVLAAAVTRLRHALGEGLQGLIESVPKRGYRLTLPVTKRPVSGVPHPQLALSAGSPVPGWPQYQLLKKISDSASAEVWVACPADQSAQVAAALEEGRWPAGDVKVFKFAVQPAAVAALQREVSLLRALRQGAAEPDRFVSLTHWQFGDDLNAMGTDWAGVPLDAWWQREGRGDALDGSSRRALMLAFLADTIIVPLYVVVPDPKLLFWLGPLMGLSFGGVFGLFGAYFAELFPEEVRAMGSGFAFNIGLDNFLRSGVLRRINEGSLLQAACAMEMWRKADFEGERIVIDALVRRRAAEVALFLKPVEEPYIDFMPQQPDAPGACHCRAPQLEPAAAPGRRVDAGDRALELEVQALRASRSGPGTEAPRTGRSRARAGRSPPSPP